MKISSVFGLLLQIIGFVTTLLLSVLAYNLFSDESVSMMPILAVIAGLVSIVLLDRFLEIGKTQSLFRKIPVLTDIAIRSIFQFVRNYRTTLVVIVALVAVGGITFYLQVRAHTEKFDYIEQSIAGVACNGDLGVGNCDQEIVYQILNIITESEYRNVWTPIVSWQLRDTESDFENYLAEVFSSEVIHRLRDEFDTRVHELLEFSPVDAQQQGSGFSTWVTELRVWSTYNRILYEDGFNDPIPEFSSLVSYIYGEAVPNSFLERDTLLEDILAAYSTDQELGVYEKFTTEQGFGLNEEFRAGQEFPSMSAQNQQLLASKARELIDWQIGEYQRSIESLTEDSLARIWLQEGALSSVSQAQNVSSLVASEYLFSSYWEELRHISENWLTDFPPPLCVEMQENWLRVNQYLSAVNITNRQPDTPADDPTTSCLSLESAALGLVDSSALVADLSNQISISPEILNTRNLFDRVRNLRTFSAPTDNRFSVWSNLSETRSYWQTEVLVEIEELLVEYEALISEISEPESSETRFEVGHLLQNHIGLVIESALVRAQRTHRSDNLYDDGSIRPVSGEESRIAQSVFRFRESISQVLNIEALLSQLQLYQLEELFSYQNRYVAISMLEDTYFLSTIFEPNKTLNPNADTLAGVLFDLEDFQDVEDYLQVSIERTILISEYAEPPLVYILNTGSPSVIDGSVELTNFWRDTLTELEKYQKNDPTSAVSHLIRFFHTELIAENSADCIQFLPGESAKDRADIYSIAETRLIETIRNYCTNVR